MTISLQSKARIIFGGETVLMGAMMIRAIVLDRNPMRYFDEGGLITWLSTLQLLWLGYLAWAIAQLRKPSKAATQSQDHPKVKRLWQIMAAGFVFLAMDEHFQIHEGLDAAILQLFNLSDATAWRGIDDFIILLYALGGLLFLWDLRRQERSILSQAAGWFKLGFGFCFLTIALDMLSHGSTRFVPWLPAAEQIRFYNWFKAIEEIPKIFAEGAFMMALYTCLSIAQQARSSRSTGSPAISNGVRQSN